MSIKVMQIKRDKKIQLSIILNTKLEFEINKDGELFKKMIKRIPVNNSIIGYLMDIKLLQLLHLPL